MQLPLFLVVFVDVSIHFLICTRIWIRIPSSYGSGSTTLLLTTSSLLISSISSLLLFTLLLCYILFPSNFYHC
jgi:hypothetical protein